MCPIPVLLAHQVAMITEAEREQEALRAQLRARLTALEAGTPIERARQLPFGVYLSREGGGLGMTPPPDPFKLEEYWIERGGPETYSEFCAQVLPDAPGAGR